MLSWDDESTARVTLAVAISSPQGNESAERRIAGKMILDVVGGALVHAGADMLDGFPVVVDVQSVDVDAEDRAHSAVSRRAPR